jgi:hypothetical protein
LTTIASSARINRAYQIAAAIGLLLVVLPIALPHDTHASSVLQNFVHGPVFGLVAMATLRTIGAHPSMSGRRAGTRTLIAFAVTAGIAAASEIAQIPGPRDASFEDLIVNFVGAATALALVRRHEVRSPDLAHQRLALGLASLTGSLFLLAPLLPAAVAYGIRYQQLPDLVRFHGPRLDAIDTYFIVDSPVHPAFLNLPDRWRKPDDPASMKVPLPPILWPGLSLDEPYPDWRAYSSLLLDLTNPGDRPLELSLRIHDVRHDHEYSDRFNWRITLPAQSRETIRVPLAAVRDAPRGRQMDLEHIAGLLLFRTGPERADVVYVTRITLEK